MTTWLNQFCRWESAKLLWQRAGRRLLPPKPLFIPCCKCLQFDAVCNSQYLEVA